MTSYRQIMMSLTFFQFMADLEHSGAEFEYIGRNSLNLLNFLLAKTFNVTKTGNRI